jgi:hypothetical protein
LIGAFEKVVLIFIVSGRDTSYYEEQLHTLKNRAQTGRVTLDEYEAKQALLDDICGGN